VAERMSLPSVGVSYLKSASFSGADERVGCQMPLTGLRFPFRENVDERRFCCRLTRLLEVIQVEIARESADLRLSVERMADCAAFSLEALENGRGQNVCPIMPLRGTRRSIVHGSSRYNSRGHLSTERQWSCRALSFQ
jgi:hypothetical protein